MVRVATGYVVPERPDWTRARLAPAGDSFAAVRWHEGAAHVWVGSGGAPMQLVSEPRPWLLQDYVWSADGRALILTVEVSGGTHAVVWLDLQAQTVARLSPGLQADAHYAGQTDSSRPGALVAIRSPQTSSFRLQLVTPAGAVRREWQPPAGHTRRWLASGTQAVAVCFADAPGAGS